MNAAKVEISALDVKFVVFLFNKYNNKWKDVAEIYSLSEQHNDLKCFKKSYFRLFLIFTLIAMHTVGNRLQKSVKNGAIL